MQDLLSPNGCFYMVAVEDNDPAEMISVMQGYGVHAEVSRRPVFFGCKLGMPSEWISDDIPPAPCRTSVHPRLQLFFASRGRQCGLYS